MKRSRAKARSGKADLFSAFAPLRDACLNGYPTVRPFLLSAVLFVAACSGRRPIDLPIEVDTRAVIVAVESAERPLRLTAISPGERWFLFVDEDEVVNVTALLYLRTLDDLGLLPGPITRAPAGAGRPLPQFDTVLTDAFSSGGARGWQRQDTLPSSLRDFRIESNVDRPDAVDCAEQGGCLVGRMCTTPCPPPSAVRPPSMPAEAAPPAAGPCPVDWVDQGVCAPPPRVTAQCPPAEMQRVGAAGCDLIGAACSGDWPVGLPASPPTLFVRAGAVGGDGTADQPYANVADAVAAASGPVIVALARGTHDGAVMLPDGVQLWGACPAETIVAGPVTIEGMGAVLRDVQLADVLLQGAAELEIRGAIVRGAVSARGDVTLAVRDSALRTASRHAIDIADGATATVDRSVISGHDDAAIRLDGAGTNATLADVVVRAGARALYVQGAAQLSVERGLFERLEGRAATVRGGGRATMSNVVVRDVGLLAGGLAGNGIELSGDSRLDLRGALFERLPGSALFVSGSAAVVADVRIRDTVGRSSGSDTGAITVEQGADVQLSRILIEDSVERGIYAIGPGSQLRLEDITVRGVAAVGSQDGSGSGIEVNGGGQLMGDRLSIADSQQRGIRVAGSSTATVADLLVTRVGGDRSAGFSISGQAWASLRRVQVVDVQGVGGRLLGAGRGRVEDLVVMRAMGGGVGATGGSQVTIERAQLSGNVLFGIAVFNLPTIVTAVDCAVTGTVDRPGCTSVSCAGRGLDAAMFGQIELTRFVLDGNAGIGVLVNPGGGQVDLHDGEVVGHQTGALVAQSEFDASRLLDRVLYRDNQIAIDLTADR